MFIGDLDGYFCVELLLRNSNSNRVNKTTVILFFTTMLATVRIPVVVQKVY